MTPNDFRDLALGLPEAVESSHMGHPDFRIWGKIFATLAPDNEKGMVKLTPAQQSLFVRTEPNAFVPVKGTWGLRGATYIILDKAEEPSVRQALAAAWRNTAPKRLAESLDDTSN